jgi:hypothetical protein
MAQDANIGAELRALRVAAEQGDWNGCRAATQELLVRLPMPRALQLARDHVARRLPAFERHQPSVSWPRQFIGAVGEPPSTDSGMPWPDQDEFPGPGANSFISAVRALVAASQSLGDAQQCTQHLVDAFSKSIMAEKCESWGARNPEEWALWHELAASGENDPRIDDIQLAIKRDPEAAAVQRTAWLDVADRLEAALREG